MVRVIRAAHELPSVPVVRATFEILVILLVMEPISICPPLCDCLDCLHLSCDLIDSIDGRLGERRSESWLWWLFLDLECCWVRPRPPLVHSMCFHLIRARLVELADCWPLLNGTMMARRSLYLHDYSMPFDSTISIKRKT